MRSLSVKSKIALVVTACTVVLTAAVLVFMLGAVDKANERATESKLFAASAGVSTELTVESGMVFADDDDVFVKEGTFSAVYDERGHFLCGHMPTAELDELPFAKGQLQYWGSWTVLDATFDVNGYGTVYVRSVADSQTTAGFVTRLKELVAVALALVAVLTAVATTLILRRFFRPMDRMIATTDCISAGADLSQRLELGRSRDEFYELGVNFNEMMDRLEESFDKERRFTSNASHELRTPISVILSESEMALEDGRSASERQESLGKIHGQAAHMSALVNQLLMLARADRGATQIQHEQVDLSELMELVGETGRDLAAERDISVTTDVQSGICVTGDQGLLMRMVLNLVENAIRYGREGGHVEVALRVHGGNAVGRIADDGIGISADDLPLIWGRFYQVDSARSGPDRGSGLGLAMVRFVAEAHGGSIECASELGKGSAFTFSLPLEANSGQCA